MEQSNTDQTLAGVNELLCLSERLENSMGIFSYFRHPSDSRSEVVEDDVVIGTFLHLNKANILNRLNYLTYQYGGASEKNESFFSSDIDDLIVLIDLYDKAWMKRDPELIVDFPNGNQHSVDGIELVTDFIQKLKEIPDYCAECFPFETIDKLTEEYLTWNKKIRSGKRL